MYQGPPKPLTPEELEEAKRGGFLKEPEGLFEGPKEDRIEKDLISISNQEPLDGETIDEIKEKTELDIRKKILELWNVLDQEFDIQEQKRLFLKGLKYILDTLDVGIDFLDDSGHQDEIQNKIILLRELFNDLKKDNIPTHDMHVLMDKLESMFPTKDV